MEARDRERLRYMHGVLGAGASEAETETTQEEGKEGTAKMIYRLEDRAYDGDGGTYTWYTSKRASQRALAVLEKDWQLENKRRAAQRAAGYSELEDHPYDRGPYPCPVRAFTTPTTQRAWMEFLSVVAGHADNG
jgi:hypothetical protein